ncbi:MAG TPA: creatininase family protein [Candidatus Limiplasma sp.]|nr:creatininase family protein [Candidatus Limiplasma sp.]HPS82198.1 creatininase family protein [Candidatus Limiplasma sp.]
MRTVQLELLRPDEIVSEQARISLAYLPVGPVEWHSYHMPMGTDGLVAQEAARRMARLTGGVVAPTLFIGTERHNSDRMLTNLNVPHPEGSYIWGIDFPANTLPSLYYREEVFAAVVREQLRLLAKMGFRMVVVVNGHGALGQVETLKRVCDEVSHEHGVHCLYPDYEGSRATVAAQVAGLNPGHADRLETSLMMRLTDSVALDRLPERSVPLHTADFGIASGTQFAGTAPKDGVVPDDPRDATAELGETMLAADTQDAAEYILAYYREHVGQPG